MKRLSSILLMLLALVKVSGSQEVDSLYLSANEAYSEGLYEAAIENYSMIIQAGFESADLYFNMGNAAFRSNKLGYSVLYYKKALKLDPQHEEAVTNLGYVLKYKEDNLDQVPELFLRKWMRSVYHLFTLKTWSLLSIVFFALLLLGVLLYIFPRRMGVKKTGFFSGLMAFVFFIISLTAAIERTQEINDPDEAVIIDPSVVVKSSPSLSGTDLFVLHEGTEIVLNETISGWMEIRISDGRMGWIPEESLALI